MKDKRLIWFKGEIIPVDEAKINVLSPLVNLEQMYLRV